MRLRVSSPWLLAALLLGAPSAHAEFNPQGRSKKPKTTVHQPAPAAAAARPGTTKKPAASPSSAATSAAPAETDGAKPEKSDSKGPNSEALIKRYTGVVLAQPGADFPLQRLIELYRERDGQLDGLIADLTQRAEAGGPTRYAALVARAGIEKLEGRTDRAQAAYERAIGEDPKNPIAVVALARMLNERGEKAQARARFEQALPALKDDADREQVLRTLLGLCLDLKDYDAAKRYHEDLVKRAGGSFFVRAELGRELLARGAYERAAAEYKTVVRAASGDNRVLAPALRDYGKALEKLGQTDEALTQFRRALELAGESGVRREIEQAIVETYRQKDRLPELIGELEKRNSARADDLRLLASLYEETGQVEKALATYRRALAADGKDLATHLKVVHLLEVRGDLDQAIGEYDALIRAAPRNPDFVFQLAEALISRGDRKKALTRLQELEARSQNDEETLAALVDFYERVDEKDRAMALLQRLAGSAAADPEHLVELGARYWQEGDKKKALATWQRIRAVVPDRARALLMLGDIYLEHDMPKEALAALSEASKLAPKQPRYRKALALALERTSSSVGSREGKSEQFDEARKIWEELIKEGGADPNLAREARQHIITLYSLEGQLGQRVPILERRLAQNPLDLDPARLLAEAHLRLRRYGDAERVLNRVIEKAPGDVESLTSLERVLVLERKLHEAIGVLEKLVAADPKRAREYYQRMASYAAELYEDDAAVRYAARAVELSPDDAEGHKKLGEMYRKRQEIAKSINEFRQAISKNERLFPVYLELAELLLGQGETDDADMLLRRVVRASPDEELVSQAARLSMQVNLGRGTLESLERDLLPLALNSPDRPIYRQLLLEVYGALTYPLLEREKSDDPKAADAARAALDKIGERAVKPLLDALGDAREAEQEVAITLLGHVQNKSAGPTLFSYALGSADGGLRARAMLAVGMLRDPALLPRFESALVSSGHATAEESDPVLLAAVWSVARMRSPRAEKLLGILAQSDAPDVSALGVVGLGLLGAKSGAKVASKLVHESEASPLARAAAAFTLAELGQKSDEATLDELTEAPDDTLAASAVLSLSRLNSARAPRAIADALTSSEPLVSDAAAQAALVYGSGYRKPKEVLPALDGSVNVRTLLDSLRPSGYSASERVATLDKLSNALATAFARAAAISPERARAVADLLVVDPGKLPFGALSADADFTPAERAHVVALARELGSGLVPTFVALARHPSPDVRLSALRFLAHRAEPAAKAAVAAALKDELTAVRRAALAALDAQDPEAKTAVIELLAEEQDWALRASAVETLGRVAAGSRDPAVVAALSASASKDSFAIVREAALPALVAVDPAAAQRVLTQVHDSDPEPRVKARALALLEHLR